MVGYWCDGVDKVYSRYGRVDKYTSYTKQQKGSGIAAKSDEWHSSLSSTHMHQMAI